MTGKGAFENEGFVPVFSCADRCAAIKLAGTYHLIPASNEPSAVLARAFGECREGHIPRCSVALQV